MGDENTQDQDDKFARLLTIAAERAGKKEAEEALKKGFVTRGDINMALEAFGAQLEDAIVDKIGGTFEERIQKAVKTVLEADPEGVLAKATRKGTVANPEDERDADPIAFLIKKGRVAAAEGKDPNYDDTEKRILWAVTH